MITYCPCGRAISPEHAGCEKPRMRTPLASSSMAEPRIVNPVVGGSSPSSPATSVVNQSAEQKS